MEDPSLPAKEIANLLNSDDTPASTKLKLQQALDIVNKTYSMFKPEEIAMSFNGGKDCLVMLYIILAVAKSPLQTVYIRNADTFTEVDEFVDVCQQKYNLDMEVSTLPMKEALDAYLHKNSHIKAIFVGVRRADPWSKDLEHMQPTDHGWPDFLRIHPILEWNYDEIWWFLRRLKIPYCSLYDRGYTSLGSTVSTVRNPSLKKSDGSYSPAYDLEDPTLERIGRNVKP